MDSQAAEQHGALLTILDLDSPQQQQRRLLTILDLDSHSSNARPLTILDLDGAAAAAAGAPACNNTGFGQPQHSSNTRPTNNTDLDSPTAAREREQPFILVWKAQQQQQRTPYSQYGIWTAAAAAAAPPLLTIRDLDGPQQPQTTPTNNTTSPSGSTANTTRPYNATLTGVSENLKNTNNETAADFANNVLAVHNRERAAVGVQPLVLSNNWPPTPDLMPSIYAHTGVTR